MVKLSKRLKTIADYVPEGSRLADIGSDHALLPVYLAERGRILSAVAGEIAYGPLQAAARQVREAGLGSRIDVRKGDGLSVLQPGEADAVTIAGMGGALIVQILQQGKPKLDGVRKLILQPNVAEDQVRRWLKENDWLLEDESLLEEDGKYYEVLAAVRHPRAQEQNRELYRPRKLADEVTMTEEWLLRLGPHLSARPSPLFFAKWLGELEKLDRIIAGMAKAETEAARIRRKELIEQRKRLEEVLSCLQKDKRSFN
jgi:tRNA (adenine22-N1)-methyltransferase